MIVKLIGALVVACLWLGTLSAQVWYLDRESVPTQRKIEGLLADMAALRQGQLGIRGQIEGLEDRLLRSGIVEPGPAFKTKP